MIGGPYQDEQAALASVGGALPPDQEIVHGSGALANGSDADSVYVLQRVPVVAGSDFRSADPGTSDNGLRDVRFTLTNEAGDRFYEYTSANVGHAMAVVLGGRVREVANIKSAIRDSGEIEGSFSAGRSRGPFEDAAHRRAAGFARTILKTARWARRWARTPLRKA